MCAYFSKLLRTHFLLSKYFAAISVASSVQDIVVHKGAPAPLPFLRHPPLDPTCPPFSRFLFPFPSYLFHSLLRCFRQFPPVPQATPLALILKTLIKTLWLLFMDRVQLPQGYRATLRRQFTFTTKFPEILGTHLIDLRRMKG